MIATGIDLPPCDPVKYDEASLVKTVVNSEKWAAFVVNFHELPLSAVQKQGQIL